MRALCLNVPALLLGSLLSGCGAPPTVSQSTGERLTARDNEADVYLNMSESDVRLANAALDRALERRASGATERWRNAATGNQGAVTPIETFRALDGTYCRRYREVVLVAGRRVTHQDVACRRQPSFWVPVSG